MSNVAWFGLDLPREALGEILDPARLLLKPVEISIPKRLCQGNDFDFVLAFSADSFNSIERLE